MRAIQSSTALMESIESWELRKQGDRGSYAALHFVSQRFGVTVVNEVSDSPGRHGRFVDPDFPSSTALLPSIGGGGAVQRTVSAPAPRLPERQAIRLETERVAEGAGLVHDMGNLLGALGLYAELLAMPGVLREGFEGYAQELRQLSERSSSMMAQLAGRPWSEKEQGFVALDDIVSRMQGLLQRVAGRTIEVEFAEGSHRLVTLNEEAAERILTNLVKNAGEAVRSGEGQIKVRVEGAGTESEPRVILSVIDEGCGMTGAQLGSLGLVRSGAGGRGLGFRVVRELAAITGGLMGVSSEPGCGTTVTIEWEAVVQVEIETAGSTRRVLQGSAGWIGC